MVLRQIFSRNFRGRRPGGSYVRRPDRLDRKATVSESDALRVDPPATGGGSKEAGPRNQRNPPAQAEPQVPGPSRLGRRERLAEAAAPDPTPSRASRGLLRPGLTRMAELVQKQPSP